jgi:hypothetical protein
VWLTESEIGGRIIAVGAMIDTHGDRAIQADRCRVTGDIRLIQGFRATAEIRLIGGQLGGSLDLAGCRLKSRKGRALDLAEATLGGSLFITDSPRHTPAIGGRLEMGGAGPHSESDVESPTAGEGRHLDNAKDPAERLAVVAQGAGIRGDLSLEEKSCVVGGNVRWGEDRRRPTCGRRRDSQRPGPGIGPHHARIGSKISAKGAKQRILDGVDLLISRR